MDTAPLKHLLRDRNISELARELANRVRAQEQSVRKRLERIKDGQGFVEEDFADLLCTHLGTHLFFEYPHLYPELKEESA